jgi:hypothetical protein
MGLQAPLPDSDDCGMNSNGTGGVAYLTTIAVEEDTPQIPLWRAISGGGDLWFERYGHDGWREDEQLGEAVTAMGTLRLTMSEARWIAAEQFGAAW